MEFTMCSECLKNYASAIEETHPQTLNRPELGHQKYYEFNGGCCGCPDDCADFLSGKCVPEVEKD